MITPTYDYLLVLASVLVSLMASFTGLTLTKGISALPEGHRKVQIVMAALALGAQSAAAQEAASATQVAAADEGTEAVTVTGTRISIDNQADLERVARPNPLIDDFST